MINTRDFYGRPLYLAGLPTPYAPFGPIGEYQRRESSKPLELPEFLQPPRPGAGGGTGSGVGTGTGTGTGAGAGAGAGTGAGEPAPPTDAPGGAPAPPAPPTNAPGGVPAPAGPITSPPYSPIPSTGIPGAQGYGLGDVDWGGILGATTRGPGSIPEDSDIPAGYGTIEDARKAIEWEWQYRTEQGTAYDPRTDGISDANPYQPDYERYPQGLGPDDPSIPRSGGTSGGTSGGGGSGGSSGSPGGGEPTSLGIPGYSGGVLWSDGTMRDAWGNVLSAPPKPPDLGELTGNVDFGGLGGLFGGASGAIPDPSLVAGGTTPSAGTAAEAGNMPYLSELLAAYQFAQDPDLEGLVRAGFSYASFGLSELALGLAGAGPARKAERQYEIDVGRKKLTVMSDYLWEGLGRNDEWVNGWVGTGAEDSEFINSWLDSLEYGGTETPWRALHNMEPEEIYNSFREFYNEAEAKPDIGEGQGDWAAMLASRRMYGEDPFNAAPHIGSFDPETSFYGAIDRGALIRNATWQLGSDDAWDQWLADFSAKRPNIDVSQYIFDNPEGAVAPWEQTYMDYTDSALRLGLDRYGWGG